MFKQGIYLATSTFVAVSYILAENIYQLYGYNNVFVVEIAHHKCILSSGRAAAVLVYVTVFHDTVNSTLFWLLGSENFHVNIFLSLTVTQAIFHAVLF